MFRCPSCGAFNRVAPGHAGTPTCGRCKRDLDVSGKPQEVDAESYTRAITNSPVPVVVDFWAPWCGPCRPMAPTFARAAGELEPDVRLAKVDTESEQQLAARFNIRSIPTLAIFFQGREIARQSGALDLGTLKRWIQPHLRKA